MTGVIPFGAVMGTVSSEKGLSALQSFGMNLFVYAGAAQLAAVDLMSRHAPIFIVVITGLIINLRFLLYSAALSPRLRKSGFWTKFVSAYFLTDQSYAVMTVYEDRLQNNEEVIAFYFGSVACMTLCWHLSVMAGFAFGNFAPATWSLDYAVPLSFVALVIPSLKNLKYVYVAVFSFAASLIFKQIPYNLGLIVTSLSAILLATFLTRKKAV